MNPRPPCSFVLYSPLDTLVVEREGFFYEALHQCNKFLEGIVEDDYFIHDGDLHAKSPGLVLLLMSSRKVATALRWKLTIKDKPLSDRTPIYNLEEL